MTESLLLLIVIYSLVTWRITSLLVNEGGPFDMFQRLRNVIGVYVELSPSHGRECKGKNVIAEMLCCIKCTSIWIAGAVVAVFWLPTDTGADVLYFFVRTLVLSAAAIIIDRVVIGLEGLANGTR